MHMDLIEQLKDIKNNFIEMYKYLNWCKIYFYVRPMYKHFCYYFVANNIILDSQ